MNLLLDENTWIWVAGLSLVAVYLIAGYVRLRYCKRCVTDYGRFILQTYGRDMHAVPESVLQYYRQDIGAYRVARRLFVLSFLCSGADLLPIPAASGCGKVRLPKRLRPVLGRLGHPAAGLKRCCHAGIMKFEQSCDDELWYEKDWDRRLRDDYLRLMNEK